MSQISAIMEKIVKEFYRDKVNLFFTIVIPLFFVVVMPIMWGDVPPAVIPPLRGGLSLTMITFLIMIGGQSNLAGSIAADRGRGLYLKIASMPVSPLKEGLGRILGIFIYLLLGAAAVLGVGMITGGNIPGGESEILGAIGFYLLIALSSTGIGLVIASLVKAESAATHSGIALTLITAFVGGLFVPYNMLPSVFQIFARINPITSANAAIIFLLEGEQFAYYNPLNPVQVGASVVLSVALFMSGMILYSTHCWLKE
jgi:ABC-type multidrug transport system permease subunit